MDAFGELLLEDDSGYLLLENEESLFLEGDLPGETEREWWPPELCPPSVVSSGTAPTPRTVNQGKKPKTTKIKWVNK